MNKKPVRVKKKIPVWAPNKEVRVVNIDPSPWVYRVLKKTKPSVFLRTKNWFVGSNGILRKDLFSVFKRKKISWG